METFEGLFTMALFTEMTHQHRWLIGILNLTKKDPNNPGGQKTLNFPANINIKELKICVLYSNKQNK